MNHPVLKFLCRRFSHLMLCVSFLCTILGLRDRGLEVDTPDTFDSSIEYLKLSSLAKSLSGYSFQFSHMKSMWKNTSVAGFLIDDVVPDFSSSK
jgi:hypothetical protein